MTYGGCVGRGTATTTATVAPRRSSAISAKGAELPPEYFWGRSRGRVDNRLYNRYRITPESYELIYQLRAAGLRAAAEEAGVSEREVEAPIAVQARDVADLMPDMDGPTASRMLRELGEAEHVKVVPDGRALRFEPARELYEFFRSQLLFLPTMRDAKTEEGSRLGMHLMRNSAEYHANGYPDVVYLQQYNNSDHPIRHGAVRAGLARQGRHVAKAALKGEDQVTIGIVDAGKVPSGARVNLVLTPFRFKKGRRQDPMVVMRFALVSEDGGMGVDISRSDSNYFRSDTEHIVRAVDLLDACALLDDPDDAARPGHHG